MSGDAVLLPATTASWVGMKRALRDRAVTRVAVTITLHLLAMNGRPPHRSLECMSICGDCKPGVMGAFITASRSRLQILMMCQTVLRPGSDT